MTRVNRSMLSSADHSVWLGLGLFVSLLMQNSPWPYTGMCIGGWWGENLILALEIVDIPSPGGTKRHFCFLWSPSSGINAASCNLSLEPSKTLRHLMTLQGRLSSPWRAGGGGGGVLKSWATTVYLQLSSAHGDLTHKRNNSHRYNCVQCSLHLGPVHFHWTVALSQKTRGPPRCHCGSKWGVGILTPAQQAQHSRATAVSFADCTNKTLETLGQMAQLWGMKNNLVPNVMFFNTPFMVGCSADPLGNNVAFCVSSASPPFSIPCAEK